MKIAIKNGKIYDVCSDLKSKRDNTISDEDYLDLPLGDWFIGDTWNFEKNISMKDSPMRFVQDKTNVELLQEKIDLLESRINNLEKR